MKQKGTPKISMGQKRKINGRFRISVVVVSRRLHSADRAFHDGFSLIGLRKAYVRYTVSASNSFSILFINVLSLHVNLLGVQGDFQLMGHVA